jgi:glucosamine-6-phosphate isomerase
MHVNVFSDYPSLSSAVAGEIIELVRTKPAATLCMASGDSPKGTCTVAVQKANAQKLDFSQLHFVGLDEWLGIPSTNSGSCQYFFKTYFLGPLLNSPKSVYLFDALAKDPQKECKKMDEHLFQLGPIDLMIVGIGMNGHIGFNEPGISFDLYSHVAQLDETTTTVGQKYFDDGAVLKQGITLGLKHLMEAKKLILLANGAKKAEVIQKAVEGKVSNDFPASIVQLHPNCEVIIDNEAAAALQGTRNKVQGAR